MRPLKSPVDGKIAAVSGARLSERAYDMLLEWIMAGRLAAGAPLQERRLSEDLGLSRSPVRDAISRLEEQGLLVRQASGAVTVRVVQLPDALHCLQIAQLVEPDFARRGASEIDPAALEPLEARIVAYDPFPAGPENGYEIASIELHLLIAEACGNPYAPSLVGMLHRHLGLYALASRRRLTEAELASARDLIAAARSGEGESLAEAVTARLATVRTAVLAAL